MSAINCIEHFATTLPMAPRLSGRWLVSARIGCWYPPVIHTDDLLDVDFDVRAFCDDGLYLLELVVQEYSKWRGCRRLTLRLDGSLLLDEDGEGAWRPLDSGDARLTIVGFVREVYRPAGRVSALAVAEQAAVGRLAQTEARS